MFILHIGVSLSCCLKILIHNKAQQTIGQSNQWVNIQGHLYTCTMKPPVKNTAGIRESVHLGGVCLWEVKNVVFAYLVPPMEGLRKWRLNCSSNSDTLGIHNYFPSASSQNMFTKCHVNVNF